MLRTTVHEQTTTTTARKVIQKKQSSILSVSFVRWKIFGSLTWPQKCSLLPMVRIVKSCTTS